MTTETTITRAGHCIKFISKKIDIGNGTENYVLDLVVEDEDGENCHTVHVFTSKPTEFYRVTGNAINTFTSADKLIEKGELVRQVDKMNEEESEIFDMGLVAWARRRVAVYGDIREGEEGYDPEIHGGSHKTPKVYGEHGVGKTTFAEESDDA